MVIDFNIMPADLIVKANVNVLRYCHQVNVQGKCHYGESDIEPEGTTKATSIQ